MRLQRATQDGRQVRWHGPLALGCVLLCGVLARAADEPVAAKREVGIKQKLDVQVPLELEFIDEQGQKVRLGDLLNGRPVILNMVYYQCPMLCNLAMDGLVQSLRGLAFTAGEEFTVVTVSFDPREGPELAAAAQRTALARYGRAADAADWRFLTGAEPQIKQLADTVGFDYRYEPQTGQYAHAAGIIVLTPEGRTSRYLLGVEYAPRDVRLALVEASRNEIGTVTDQVMLLCYQYDPLTAKYGLLIHNVLRLAGIATVLGIAATVGLLLIRERRAGGNGGQHAAADRADDISLTSRS